MRRTAWFVTLTLISACGLLPGATFAEEEAAQKAVLITGASSGIGRYATERLAKAGYFVYAGARKDADLAELDKLDNVMALRLDVTRDEDIAAAVARVTKAGRGLWGIVNNAGVNAIDPLIEAHEADLDFVFDVNVYGVFRVTKAFAPLVVASQGRIVNVSSISGILSGGLTGYGMYSMSKHAIEAYTDQLAFEMAPLGVTVSGIEPGSYGTDIGVSRCERMLAEKGDRKYRYFAEEMQRYYDDCRRRIAGNIPSSAPPPDDVAEAIEHALFSEHPKEHYLVVFDPFEAEITIRKSFEELLQLNRRHDFSYSREQLLELMDDEWAILEGEKERTWD